MKALQDRSLLLGASVVLMVVFLIGASLVNISKSVDEKRTDFLSIRDSIVGELITEEKYRCCLEKPCTYCIEKTPKHGEGASCNCLEDVVTGVHPCGECIGEILEGHGNQFLAKYFATSIAEEVGKTHLDELKGIILEKYGIPVEEQV